MNKYTLNFYSQLYQWIIKEIKIDELELWKQQAEDADELESLEYYIPEFIEDLGFYETAVDGYGDIVLEDDKGNTVYDPVPFNKINMNFLGDEESSINNYKDCLVIDYTEISKGLIGTVTIELEGEFDPKKVTINVYGNSMDSTFNSLEYDGKKLELNNNDQDLRSTSSEITLYKYDSKGEKEELYIDELTLDDLIESART